MPAVASAANSAALPSYKVDEKVLCFHGPMLYEAKVLEVKPGAEKKDPPEYKVHYKGWKNTWDEFVPQDRLRKMTDENLQLQKDLKDRARPQNKANAAVKATPDSKNKQNIGTTGNEETTAPSATRPAKRARDMDMEKEDDYLKKNEVRIAIPDSLKAALVDDWEYITSKQQLVPLPRTPNVNQILLDWRNSVPRKREGSAESDIFDEFVAGLKLYFDKTLGSTLLYRFERQQWSETFKKSETTGKTPCEIYGAEHFLRLCTKMPELIAHTNLDQQSVSKVKEHLEDLIRFIAKHQDEYFNTSYESAPQAYIEASKGI